MTTTVGEATRFQNTVRHDDTVTFAGNTKQSGLKRSDLDSDANEVFAIPLERWRVFDNLSSSLPGTPLTDDLGLVGGTHGTSSPSIQTEDLKAAGSTTSKMRLTWVLPHNYVDNDNITIRFHAGALTTIADTAMTLDCLAYRSDEESGVGSDLVSTAATSINNTTMADYDFSVTGSTLNRGDTLDIRVDVLVNDGGTGTAVKAIIGATQILVPTK